MRSRFKHSFIFFMLISLITLSMHTAELNQDVMLRICKNLSYRDITSLICTNRHYNQALNASFYGKLINSQIPTTLQSQLAYDQDIFKNVYRTQVKRHGALSPEEQPSFGLKEFLESNKECISRVICYHIQEKYKCGYLIKLITDNKKHSLHIKEIEIRSFTQEEQIAFFSNDPQPTKFEQAVNDLPLLIEHTNNKHLDLVQKLLAKHDNFTMFDPSIILTFLCRLEDYDIIKKFIEIDRSTIIKIRESLDVSTMNYNTNELLDHALQITHERASLSLFTDLMNTATIEIDCAQTATILSKCIDNEQIPWIQVIIESARTKETKQKIVNQPFPEDNKINKGYNTYTTLFRNACTKNARRILELLLPYGPGNASEIALKAACYRKDQDLVNWLLTTKDNFDSVYQDNDILLQCIIDNHKKTTEEIIISLAQKADLTILYSRKKTLLHLALENRLEKLAHFLVNKKTDVNAQDDNKKTPLHCAIDSFHSHCSLQMIEFLLKNGANPDIKDKEGKPAIHYAFSYSVENIQPLLDLLLKYGANINDTDNDNRTALHHACKASRIEIIERLIYKEKFDINAQDNFGNTPLHYSCHKAKIDILAFLLDNKANVNKINHKGEGPLSCCNLHYARPHYWEWNPDEEYSCIPIIELLVQKGANIFYTMQRRYDRIACICLLPETPETLQTLVKLFTQLDQETIKEKEKINILISLARRNNNTKTIAFLRNTTSLLNQRPKPPRLLLDASIINTPNQNPIQHKQTSMLQNYALYVAGLIFFAIGSYVRWHAWYYQAQENYTSSLF